MNNIVATYHNLRNVDTVDDLVRVLVSEYGMPSLRQYDAPTLLQKCEMVAQDWVRFRYASQLRRRATVSDVELRNEIVCAALEFYAVLRAGDVKTLYLVKPDASAFIMATAFTQKLEPEFFISNFKIPLVLYSGEPRTLFSDVLCIELFYNEEQRMLECIVSCADK